MNDHIAKPIDVAQLFLTLAKWVSPKPGAVLQTDAAVARATPIDGIPYIAGLDLDGALQRMGGSKKLLHKMITRFAETQADAMARIHAAIENNDADTAAREAHTVKGLAGNIGAAQMAALAAVVEELLKQGQNQGLAAALDAMAGEHGSLIQRIAAAIGMPAAAEAAAVPTPAVVEARGPADMATLTQALGRLNALLTDGDSDAGLHVDPVLAPLRQCGEGARAQRLQDDVENCDFDSAVLCLRDIALALNISL